MPHVIVKLYAGRTEQQKTMLADEITKVMETMGCAEESVSVSIEDVAPGAWIETVYKPDIIVNQNLLYKKPGYSPA